MLMLMALLATATVAQSDQSQLTRMAALYQQVCLKAFPDDNAVDSIMKADNARPLTPEQVKVTLQDDPGRAWELADGSATVWLELPPFHACSVRWNAPEIGDLSSYRVVAARYEQTAGGFSTMDPFDTDYGDIHVHAIGEQKQLPDGRRESLFIFDQHISDAQRRAKGETGVSLRFVHQFAPAHEQ